MIERRWLGEIAVCIASGPSLTPEDVDLCRGRSRVIAVNDNYLLAPWADILYACDFRWWDAHKGVPGFAGEKWTIDRRAKEVYPELRRIEGKNEPGFSEDPSRIHNGRNSGFQAVNLALLMGAAKILLLGYDLQKQGYKTHWFGEHQGLVNTRDYSNFIEAFNTTRRQVERMGNPIINCTRRTALNCYPKMALEQALEQFCRRTEMVA